MSVIFTPFSLKSKRNTNYSQNNFNYNYLTKQQTMADTFEKNISSCNISFTSDNNIESGKIKDVSSDLALIGIVGAPFILSIAAAIYATNKQNPEEIFLSDGSYFMSTKDMKLETDKITADGGDGIIKIKGTPINLDADKYDISDPEHGIYKNYDGSVDIDLLNNKYIDTNNGIFVDPDNKISAIMNAGKLENIVVPDISFKGASMSNLTVPEHKLTRSEYLEKHHSTPEADNKFINDEYRSTSSAIDRVTDPDDNRTVTQKILDFFNPMSPDSKFNNLYDKSKQYDIFGREIITVKDWKGNISKIALDENLHEIVNKYNLNENSIGELSEFFEKTKLGNYLLDYQSVTPFEFELHQESLNDFMTRLAENHQEVSEIITSDALAENLENTPEHIHTFWDTIKEIYTNINN